MTAEEVVVVLKVRMEQLERDIGQAATKVDAGTDRMKRAGSDLQRSLEANSSGISSAFKSIAVAIGTYFTGRELVGLIDSFTRFQNQLKGAGIDGDRLAQTQKGLFDIAQRYGVQLEAVGVLYGRNSASAKELNLTQADQLKIVEATSAALKISGASAGEASGALLQLSQLLGGTNVQAEEYNSLIDGARPLLQAVAAGSEKWGGSVAKLTQDVKSGNVTVREFVDSLLKGAPSVIDKAASATLTLSGASQTLSNALTLYVGEAAQADGVTTALATGITTLANNLNTVIPALTIIGTALGVGMVTNAVAATGSVRALGSSLLGAFGGPIGLAVTALTVSIGALAVEAAETSSLVRQADAAAASYGKTLTEAASAAHSAAGGQAAIGDQSAGAVSKIDAFAGATGRAAQQLYNLARAQRAAALGSLVQQKQGVDTRLDELVSRSSSGRTGAVSDFRRGDFLGNASILGRVFSGAALNTLSGGRTDRDINRAITETLAERDRITKQLEALKGQPLESFIPAGAGTAAAPAKGVRAPRAAAGGAGGPNKSPLDPEAFTRDLEQANQELLAARQSSTVSVEEQAKLEIQRIEDRRDARIKETDGDKRLTDAQKQQLALKYRAVAEEQKLGVQLAERRRAEDDAAQLASAEADAQRSLLQGKLSLATTADERRKIALQLVEIEFEEKRRALERIKNSATSSPAEKKIAETQIGYIDQLKGQATETATRDNEGPLDRYKRQLHAATDDMATALESVEVRGLQSLEDGLLGVINGTESVGSAFKKMAASIIADLARIAIQKAIVGALSSVGLGFADGGEIQGFADGGSPGGRIAGPGTGRSDSILAVLAGSNGAIRVSNGEYIVNEQATRRHLPLLEAINSGRSPGFADGGISGGVRAMRSVDLGALTSMQQRVLSPGAGRGPSEIVVHVQANDYFDARVAHVSGPIAQQMSVRVVQAAGPTIASQGADLARNQQARMQTLGT